MAFSPKTMSIGLILISTCIVFLSPGFDYNSHWLDRPTYVYVALMICSSVLYLCTIWPSFKQIEIKLSLKWIFFTGLFLRLMFVGSTPIWEDDFYRYFLDGALVNEGVNPYQYAPIDTVEKPAISGAAVLGIIEEPTPVAPELEFLKGEASVFRVAYPHVKTIYPPVTQAFFALSNLIKPFDLTTWRILLIVIELVSFALLLTLLKQLNKPISYVAIYWLNPLVITETVNAAHMDAIIVPFIVLTMILTFSKKVVLSGMSLAFAVGIKLWPIILAPLLFRPYVNSIPDLLKKATPFALLTLLLISPQFLSSLDKQAGVANYAQYWQTNSFIFMWLEKALSALSEIQFMPFYDPSIVSRALIAIIVISVVLRFAVQRWKSVEQLNNQWLLVIAALFLLSPTGYPWYVLWFMPLLVVTPNKALLLLTTFLPLYDLRYPLEASGNQPIFDFFIITVEFLPCLLLLAAAYFQRPKLEPTT